MNELVKYIQGNFGCGWENVSSYYSLQRIAERLNCSRQAISQMIKYYEIKEN